MTRKEQIINEAHVDEDELERQLKMHPQIFEQGFVAGAMWADAHPNNGLNFEPKPLEECIEAATPTWQRLPAPPKKGGND